MMTEPDPRQTLTSFEKVVLGIFAVIGYWVGWYLRHRAGLTGAIPGALYGGLGTAGGGAVGFAVVFALRAVKRS